MKSKILTIFIVSILILSSFAFAQTTADQEVTPTDDTVTTDQEIPLSTKPTEDPTHSDTEPTLVDFTKEKFLVIEAGTTPDHQFYYFFDRMFDTFQSPEEVAAERMHEALAMAEKARDSATEEEKQTYLTYMQRPVELFNVYVDDHIEEIKNINDFKQLYEAETNLLVMKDIFEDNKLLLESGEIVLEEESEVDNNLVTVTLRFGDALAEVEVTKEELAEAKATREERELEEVNEQIEEEEKETGIVDLRHTVIIKEYLDLKEDVETVDTLIKNKDQEESNTKDASKILTYARDTLLYRGEMDYSTIGETRKIILELKDSLREETEDTSKIESLKNEIIKIESERIQRDFDRKEQFEKSLAETVSDSEKLDLLDKYYNEERSGGLGFSHVNEISELEANGLPREQAFQVMARASLEFGFNRETLEKIAKEISGNLDFKFSQTADLSIYRSPVSVINGDLGIYKSLTERGIDKDTAAEIAVKGALTGLNRETVENLLKEKGYDISTIKNYYEGGGQYYGREMHGDASPGTLFAIKQGFLEQGISESEATRLAREEMINRLIDAGENPIRAIRREDEAERSLVRPVYGRFGDYYGPPAGSGLGVVYDKRVSELIIKGLNPDEARTLATKEMSDTYIYGLNTFGAGDASPGALSAAIAKAGDIVAGKQALIDQLVASGNSLADATRRVEEAARTYNVGYTGTYYGAPAGSGLGYKYDQYIREGLSPAEATKAVKEEYKEQYKQELEKQGWTKNEIDRRLQEISTGYGNIGGPGGYYSGPRSGLGDASPASVREKGVEGVRAELLKLGVSEAEIGIRIAEAQAALAGTVSYTGQTGFYGDSARNTAYQELITSGLRPEQAASVLSQTPDFSHASLQETARQVTGNGKFMVTITYVGVDYRGGPGYTSPGYGVGVDLRNIDVDNLQTISEREARIYNAIPLEQKQGLLIEKVLEQTQQIREQAKKEYINDLIGRGVDPRQAEELYRIQTTPIPLGGQDYGQIYGAPAGVVDYGAPADSRATEYNKLINQGVSPAEATKIAYSGAPGYSGGNYYSSSGLAQVGATVIYEGQTYTVTADKGWTDSSGRAVSPPPGQPSSAAGTYSGPGYTSYSGGSYSGYYSGPRSGLGDASPASVREKGVEGVRAELLKLGVSEAEIGQRIAEAQASIASSGGSYYSGTPVSGPNYQTAYSGSGYTSPGGGSAPSGSYSGSGSPSGSYSSGSYSGSGGSYSGGSYSSGSYNTPSSGGESSGSYSSGSYSGGGDSSGSYSGGSYSGGGDSGSSSSSGGSASSSSDSGSSSSSSSSGGDSGSSSGGGDSGGSGGDSGGSAPSGDSGSTPTGGAIIKIMGNMIKNFFASFRD